jgi:hypothetical protein
MSVNISRFIEMTLKERTSAYTPIIEAIVNSIEAIFESERSNGEIIITPIRNQQAPLETNGLADIIGFIVQDNGIGFTKKNRNSFDTICTDHKIDLGGKGLGRFTFIKYFKKVRVRSVYLNNGKYHLREFSLGLKNDIIEDEKDDETEASDTETTLLLEESRGGDYDKGLDTIAHRILERILEFFVNDQIKCPTIILRESNNQVVLNDLIGDDEEIQLITAKDFSLKNGESGEKENFCNFRVKIFKIMYPGSITSKISLNANNRQVTETPLSKYIPEFKDDFRENSNTGAKNYIIRAYVLGKYLDVNVSPDRGGFRFNFPAEDKDALYPFSQQDIEKEAAGIIENIFKDQVEVRRNKTLKCVQNYVDNSAPWYKSYVKELELTSLPYEPDEQTIEIALQKIRFRKEKEARDTLKKIIDDPRTEMFDKVNESVKHIQEAGTSELVHYVVLRKIVLDMLKKLLEIKDNGKYSKEAEIHNLIFPMKSDSETTDYENHNLWILDEKLNFTELVASDKGLDKKGENRSDIVIFDKKMVYRSGDEKSNPVTIFEFKQPHRDDFINQSVKEDPIEQIKRYARKIREEGYVTPEGRNVSVDENTPFYGYVICDFNNKVKDWLFNTKEFTPLPDGEGYARHFTNNRIYMEVLSWDKILKDARLRNKIFFKKLGIT